MKIFFKYALVALVSFVIVGGMVGRASASGIASDPAWPFQTEQKMDQAIVKYANDPLATYYVIMRAWEIHRAAEATLEYRTLVLNKPDDPYLESAYGFCQSMAYSTISFDFANPDPSSVVGQARSLQMEAQYYRDKAFLAKPNDPYILIERGVDLYSEFDNRLDTSVACLARATELTPKWAAAHFWYADALSRDSEVHGYDSEQNVQAVEEFRRAMFLDPKLAGQSLLGESGAFSLMHKYDTAIECLNEALAADPSLSQNPGVANMRLGFLQAMKGQNSN